MGWIVVEWLLKHPVALTITLVVAAGLFCFWLFGPLIWKNSEGSVVDDGENLAGCLWGFWRLFDL